MKKFPEEYSEEMLKNALKKTWRNSCKNPWRYSRKIFRMNTRKLKFLDRFLLAFSIEALGQFHKKISGGVRADIPA